MAIHAPASMQPSTEVFQKQTAGTAAPSDTKLSSPAKEDLITLRYVDSGKGAPCGPHWELIDRTKPRFDPLKGLRGRRPQSGPMPKVLTITSANVEDARAGPAEEGSMSDGASVNYPVSNPCNPHTITANHTCHVSKDRAQDHQSFSVATNIDGKRSRSASEALATNPSTPTSSSNSSQPPRETKSAEHDQISVSSSASTPSSKSKRRSQRLRDTAQSPASYKSNARTPPRRTNERSASSSLSTSDHQSASTPAPDEELSSDHETPPKTANLGDPYSEQAHPPKSPVVAPPVFGRRAHRLAKAAARKEALARFNVERPISVSAEAYRIAQQREEPSFDKTKAVATAISNRERGLRPRAMPAPPVDDDEDDRVVEESAPDTDGLEEEEDSESEDSEDSDTDDIEYDDDDDDNSYTEHEDRPLRSNPSRKRPAQNDNGADHIPVKKAKTSVAKHKHKTTTAADASSRQKLMIKDSSPEEAVASGSSPSLPANVGQTKSRPGRKSNIKIPRPFSCNICSLKFGRQEHVKRHQQSVHSGEKPYQCGVCQKRFARRDNLTQHMLSHTRDQVEETSTSETPGTYATRRGSAYGAGNSSGQNSRIEVGRGIVGDAASTEQQMRIAENHRRLADQGKL